MGENSTYLEVELDQFDSFALDRPISHSNDAFMMMTADHHDSVFDMVGLLFSAVSHSVLLQCKR